MKVLQWRKNSDHKNVQNRRKASLRSVRKPALKLFTRGETGKTLVKQSTRHRKHPFKLRVPLSRRDSPTLVLPQIRRWLQCATGVPCHQQTGCLEDQKKTTQTTKEPQTCRNITQRKKNTGIGDHLTSLPSL